MATFNLAERYDSKLENRFSAGSITDAFIGKNYDFEGVNAIKLWTLGEAKINDYTLNPAAGVSRFGEIREVGDELNIYQLTKKKSFNQSFDTTNVQDQMFVKKANAYLKQVWDEQFIPMIDADRLAVWANGAGQGDVGTTALTKTNIVEKILTGHAALSNKRVPHAGRVCFVSETTAIKCRLASELADHDTLVNKQIVNGQISHLGGAPVVAVPDDLMPAGVEFIIKYKNATADPMKLKMLRVITNSENVAGSLMQGLVRFDSFVLANKANGIYVYGGTAAPVEISVSGGTATLTAAGTVKYTTDGTNPKVSSTAKTGTSVSAPAGTVVKAYASEEGKLDSAISEFIA